MKTLGNPIAKQAKYFSNVSGEDLLLFSNKQLLDVIKGNVTRNKKQFFREIHELKLKLNITDADIKRIKYQREQKIKHANVERISDWEHTPIIQWKSTHVQGLFYLYLFVCMYMCAWMTLVFTCVV